MKTNTFIIALLLITFGCTEKKSVKSEKEQTDTVSADNSKVGSIQTQLPKFIEHDTLCSIEILKQTYDHMDSLYSGEILQFILTFDSICKNNAEYSEWSNELLFEVANKYPSKLLEQIDRNSEVDLDYILNEFSTPIHDGIYLNKTLEKMKSVPIRENSAKMKVINAINRAIENEKPAANK